MRNRRVRCMLLLCLASAFSVLAGWYAVNHEFNNVDNIRFLNERDAFMTSAGKSLLRSRDGGLSWEMVMYPSERFMFITDYHCISADTILLCGYGSGIQLFLTCDGGAHWTQVVEPSLTIATTGVFFHFYNRTFGWIGNGYEQLLRTTDAGTGWTLLPKPSFTRANDLCFLDSMKGYVASDKGIYRSTNGGISWTAVSGDAGGTSVADVDFFDVTRGYGVGGSRVFTCDGGESWAIDPAFDTARTYSTIHVLDGRHAFVGGKNGTFYATDSRGASWRDLSGGFSGDALSIAFMTPTTGLLGGSVLHRTTDGGQTWSRDYKTITRKMSRVCFIDTLNGFVGANDTVNFSHTYLMRTRDGGLTWEQKSLGNSVEIEDIEFSDTLNGWCVARPGQVYKTTDGGDTWALIPHRFGGNIFGLSFLDGDHGCVCGWYGWIYRTADGGHSWDTVQTDTDAMLQDVAYLSRDVIVAARSSGVVVRSADAGRTWTTTRPAGGGYYSSLFFLDSLHGWLIAGNRISRTLDGGATWADTSFGTENLRGLSFVDELTGYVCGEGGTLAKTIDGGQTWSLEMPKVFGRTPLNDVFTLDRGHAWAVGGSGEIFQLTPLPGTGLPRLKDTTLTRSVCRRIEAGQNASGISGRKIFGLGHGTSMPEAAYDVLGRKIRRNPGSVLPGSIRIRDVKAQQCTEK